MTSPIHKTMSASDWSLLAISLRRLGRLLPVHRGGREGAAAAHDRRPAGGDGGDRPEARPFRHGRADAAGTAGLDRLSGHGDPQQRYSLHLIVWGQKHIASGLASILNATTPLFTVIVAHYLTADERLTRQRFAGVVVGFLGVAMMIGSALRSNRGASPSRRSSPCWARPCPMPFPAFMGGVQGHGHPAARHRSRSGDGLERRPAAAGPAGRSPVGAAAAELSTVASSLGLALVSTAFAYLIFFRLLARAGATNVVLVTFLVPVSAILLGVLVLDET